MIPIDLVLLFLAASTALAVAPGPDNLFVAAQSALHGPAAGLLVTLGLCTGLLFHTSAVAFGVAAIFQTSAVAFTALKLAGAGYLLYLAWQAFRAGAAPLPGNGAPSPGPGQLWGRGIVMNVTNPKVAIFFIAFLPQFADPARGALSSQMLILGALFIAATVLVFGGIACAAGYLGTRFGRSARAQVHLNRVAGGVFAGLALRLALTER